MASYDQSSSLRATMADVFNNVDPYTILRNARGVKAETFDMEVQGANTVLASGTVYLSALPMIAGTVVNNLTICVVVAGAAITLSKVGLYSTAGSVLASSADQGTNWQSAGTKTIAMQTPYVVPATGAYYGGLIVVTASTVPAIARGMIPNSVQGVLNCVAIGSGILPYASVTGQTDLVAVTVAAGTAPGQLWMAVS